MKIIQSIPTPCFTEFVCFSPDANTLASCNYDEVIIWNLAEVTDPKKITQLVHRKQIWKCSFSPDGRILCTACSDGCMYIWNTESWTLDKKVKASKACVYSLAFSPRGDTIVTCGSGGLIKYFKLPSMKCFRQLAGHSNSIEDVDFSPCGRIVASGSKDCTVRLWHNNSNADCKTRCTILGSHEHWVLSVQFSPDGRTLASASADKAIGIWCVEDKCRLVRILWGHSNIIWRCAFVPWMDGDRCALVSVSSDRSLRLWDPDTGKEVDQLRNLGDVWDGEGQLLCCSPSPAGDLLAVGTYHGAVYLLDMSKVKQDVSSNKTRVHCESVA